MNQPLPIGTEIDFNICEDANIGRGIIREADYDDGWMYRIDVTDGDSAVSHRNKQGELWVLASEVTTNAIPVN